MDLGKLCMQAPWVLILFAVLAAAVVLLALELKRARAREEKEDREIRSILSAMEELYPLAVFADIKRNRVRFIRHHGLREGEDPGISYDDFISVGAEDTPAGEARDRFLSVFCRDAMLKAIEDGKKHLTLDTPHMMQDGQYHWMRCLHIFLNPEKKDGQTLILASVIDREIAERQEQERVNAIQESVIESLATLVESRDINTGSHVRNTRRLVTLIVEKLRETGEVPELLDDKYAQNIIVGSVLHDIGKIFISDVILNKAGKLTPEEFRVVQQHTALGKEIVEQIFAGSLEKDTCDVIRDIVYCHHERWDGRGYPKGLKGEEIPLSARIMAVADVFDALISRRAYKEPMPPEAAFEMIGAEAGAHFDARVARALTAQRDKITEYLSGGTEEQGWEKLSGALGSMVEAIQNRSVMSAFVEDYEVASIVTPDTGKVRLLYLGEHFRRIYGNIFFGKDFHETLLREAEKIVMPEDWPGYKRLLSFSGMKEQLTGRNSLAWNFRIQGEGRSPYHMQLRLIRINYAEEPERFDVLVGIRDVDAEIRQKEESLRAEQMNRDVISGLSDDYEAIFFAELNEDSVRTVRARERFVRHHPGLTDITSYADFVDRAMEQVYAEDREGLKRHLRPTQIRELLSAEESNYYEYRRVIRGELQYYQVKLIRTRQWEEKGAFIIGVHNTDEATRRDMERVHALKQARMDGLTGLLNRITFERDVDEHCLEYTSRGTSMAYLDLDTFKRMNDTLGHAAGDRILEVVAEELTKGLPHGTLIGRMGGDEFAVFFPSGVPEDVSALLRQVQLRTKERFEQMYPDSHVTLSVGGVYCEDPGLDFNDLRLLADREMYKSKLDGRNRHHFRSVTAEDAKKIE